MGSTVAKFTSSKTLLTKKRANLLTHGYTRQECQLLNIEIPTSLIELILLWFFEAFEILQFNDKYCTKNVFKFEKDRSIITKSETEHRYICVDTQPVFTDIHCWRVRVTWNSNNYNWISFGVGEYTDIGDKSWDCPNCLVHIISNLC